MVIASTGPVGSMKKSISTLSDKLDLSLYEKIIILDDGINKWCQHEFQQMVTLRSRHREFIFIKVAVFSILANVYQQFQLSKERGDLPCTQTRITMFFYSLIADNQKNDQTFARFHGFLQILQHNQSRKSVNSPKYATPMLRLMDI